LAIAIQLLDEDNDDCAIVTAGDESKQALEWQQV
jgi:hypothetical protein